VRSPISRRAGLAVRRLRLARGCTLQALSQRTGIPLSTLSKLELGQSILTHEKWTLLCKALEADPADEILRELGGGSGESPSGRRSVRHRHSSGGVRTGPYMITPTAEDLTAKTFTPLIVDLFAGSLEDHGPPRRGGGEIFVHVIEGCVVLHAEGYRPVTLAQGDSIYFDGARNHVLLAQHKPARALIVLSGDMPDWA
jgi:transcriptional regulator with XRE-family HTH domain